MTHGGGGGRPSRGGTGKSAEQLLAEALRARASGAPTSGDRGAAAPLGRPRGGSPALTLAQAVLAALIAGVTVGILLATLSLL